MSHYSVLVITPKKPTMTDIEDKLAPFDENIRVAQYIQHTKEELIENTKQKALEMKEKYEKHKANPEDTYFNEEYYLKKYPPILELIENNDDVGLYLEAIEYYEEEDLDKYGNVLSTYNPNSKWDWYQIGGRFSGLFGDKFPDTIQVKDFPKFEIESEDKLKEKYPKDYKYYQDLISGKEKSLYRLSYLKERYPTFKDYILESLAVTTYAVLDADNNWHEPGKMGWFASTTATTTDEINWTNEYYNNFIMNLPKDYWLTVGDCHI